MSRVQMLSSDGSVIWEAASATELVDFLNADHPAWDYRLVDHGHAVEETVDFARGIVYRYDLRPL